MIYSFKDSDTEDIFSGFRVKKISGDLYKRVRRKLFAIDSACSVEDLRMPPGNKLHALQGDRKGQYAIRVNDQWRICFTFKNGRAEQVELCDYH